MKINFLKILSLFLPWVIPCNLYAQEIPQYIGTPQTAVHIEGRLYVDSLMILPFTDTISIPDPVKKGALIYQNSDDCLYFFTGSFWNKLTTEISSNETFQPKLIYTEQYINDYSNNTFSLAYPPAPNTPIKLELNGLSEPPDAYSVTGQTVNITFTTQNDKIVVWYYRLAN